uniref:NBS-LRR disease resistance protein NBS49 n=1 Tax=Dimocarpus longan TaxID=128017 RepID=A0A0F6TMY5_9ROSI|nr:NBS-LRR disease resistance protein NBS49 [Dimocarpus longan]
MSMISVIIDGVVSVLMEKLFDEWSMLTEMCAGVKGLGKKLVQVKSFLADAEEKQLSERLVKNWVEEVRDLAYDVEDILDDFNTVSLKLKLEEEQQHKMESYRLKMLKKTKEVTQRLTELLEQTFDLSLQRVASKSHLLSKRLPTTSLPAESSIYGRQDDKLNLVETLLSGFDDSDSNLDVISVVGMGGIGKTTLARHVFNDAQIERYFDVRAWVGVSDDFDLFRISKVILDSIALSNYVFNDLNQLQIQLKRAVSGKRFLLVLDDVWNEDYKLWETLMSPFLGVARGSKMMVTTRLLDVSLAFKPVSRSYQLDFLSDDDCWSLFLNHAFQTCDFNVEFFRKRVVEKCNGLPLAAKTLGGLLRYKRTHEDWEDILSSTLWDLPEETDILPVLRLSYHHLPSHLKRCFCYCAILPKDYEFEAKELVMLWMAEGLIQLSNHCNKCLEDLGAEYLRDLLSRSLLQISATDATRFKMHDLVNDLAQWASGDTSLRLEDELNTNNSRFKRIERVRYSSYASACCDGKEKFAVFPHLKHLRTFLPLCADGPTRYITNMFLSDLLPKFKKLRVLSLKKYYITELPDFIGSLTNLRYLNFSGTKIRSLPESTGLLYKLQVLNLKNCSLLLKLPSDLGKLINLRHLDIMGANLINQMPLGIEKWEYLQTLSNYILGKSVGSGIEHLKNLKFLRGKLSICRLEHVAYPLTEAVLSDKKGLEVLILEWGSTFDDLRNEAVEAETLDVLQPHKNLKELVIKGYGGIRFPSWLGDPSFSNMTVLRLQNCERCTSLPSLGLLSSLKYLSIEGMTRLKSIGSEIYGEGCLKPFQSLEILCFADLEEWEHWDPVEENERVERFPRLQKLSVARCPKLVKKLPNFLPLLEELVIHECVNLVVPFSSLPMLCKLEIDGCKAMVCSSLTDFRSLNFINVSNISEFKSWFAHKFQNVECLQIDDCEELLYFWQKEIRVEKPLQGLHSLISLRKLCIRNCPNLELFPEAHFLTSLSALEIENCNNLISLPEGLNHLNARLESLRIRDCHSLKFIAKGQFPSSLKRLKVKSCEKLLFLLDDREAGYPSSAMQQESINDTNTSLLEYLHMSQCPSLTSVSFRGWLPPVLKHLEIWGCSKLMFLSSNGRLPKKLHWLGIADCSELESIAEKFDHNMSLEYIRIWGCRNLKSIPDGLHNLSNLGSIYIWDCPRLVSFPEAGLPNRNLRVLSIERCMKLKALPDRMHSFHSLQTLELRQCPNIMSIQEQGFPTNLTSLAIADLNINKPLIEWGFHKLTFLRNLDVRGCRFALSFPMEEREMMLPSSLTRLTITEFPRLKCLSSKGFQNLTSLEYLSINDCPKLTSLPEPGLPSSLLQLFIYNCPLLKIRCKRDEGEEWFKIAHIPRVRIDGSFIYDTKLEEGSSFDLKDREEGRI